MTYHRKPSKVSKLSITVSALLHSAAVLALVYLAAREGVFGKRATNIAVTLIPQEKNVTQMVVLPVDKPVEPPEKKPEKSKPSEPPKGEVAVKTVQVAVAQLPLPPADNTSTADVTPPAMSQPTLVAPPAAVIPGFIFGAANNTESSSDPETLYRGFLEYSLRSNWRRPAQLQDADLSAEIKVSVDSNGKIVGVEWAKGSGNPLWDDSVRAALAKTKSLERPPPRGFPSVVLVKFDVQVERNALNP